MQRDDDFAVRRRKIAGLTDEQLERRFWQLTERVVDPLVDLARGYTSPSIERSVLMRMGFSGPQAKAIVDKCVERRLLGKGAGHVVYRLAKHRGMDVAEAGRAMAEGGHWDEVALLFRKARVPGGGRR
ncbi:MAG: ornithine aminomutase subunit alpha [Bacillota bacterium]